MTTRRLIPLLLLLACDPEPTPHTGAIGTNCTQDLACDSAMASNPAVGGVVCLSNSGLICSAQSAPCEGLCVDIADPASPCPQGLTRCETQLGSGCVDVSGSPTIAEVAVTSAPRPMAKIPGACRVSAACGIPVGPNVHK